MSLLKEGEIDPLSGEPSRGVPEDPEALERLRKQYPSIATRVYHNLSGILAVQLGKTTGMVAFPPEAQESGRG